MQPLHIGFNSSHCGRFLLAMANTRRLGNHTLTRRRLHESHPVRTFLWHTFRKAILDLPRKDICDNIWSRERIQMCEKREHQDQYVWNWQTTSEERRARSEERGARTNEREPKVRETNSRGLMRIMSAVD